jgi:hypothetical protein
MEIVAVGVVAKTIGPEIIVKSITSAASGIVSGIKYFISTPSSRKDIKDIQDLIERLDIEAEIQVIEAYVKDYQNINDKEAISIALTNLSDIINKLHKEIDTIKEKVEQDSKLTYIGSWWYGYSNLTGHFGNIEMYWSRLTKRFKLLRNVKN